EPRRHSRARPRPGARERERWRDRNRPSARDERRAARRDAAPRAPPPRGQGRAADALRRSRPGPGAPLRAMSDVGVEYVELGLRLGRHQDGLVDSYYGPAEIKERVDAEELREPAALAEDTARLRDSLDGLDDDRSKWLDAQLVGLETAARKLAGAEISFEEEGELYYGVPPHRTPESEFEASHKAIDALRPGNGSLEERYRVWREDDTIPAARLAEVVSRLNRDLQKRAVDLVGLPEGESVDYEYVSDKPGPAHNHYRRALPRHTGGHTAGA